MKLRIWNTEAAREADDTPYALRLTDSDGEYIALEVVNRKGEKVFRGNVLFIEEEGGRMIIRRAGGLTEAAGFRLDGDRVSIK